MLSINTNLSSLIAQNSMKTSTDKLNQAIERMTTGAKINQAKDNAANYSISTNMTTKIGAYQVAEDNALMGLDMVTTASDTIGEMQNHAERLRALATQARNGTYGKQSLNAMQEEANAIYAEINRLYSTAKYNGVSLFNLSEYDLPDNMPKADPITGFIENPYDYIEDDLKNITSISKVTDSFTESTYKIETVDDLVKLAELTNNGLDTTGKTFVLANDLDLKEYCEQHEAEGGWTPIGIETNSFKGSFNGNGHVIYNLTINRPNSDYQGLFRYTVGSNNTISNLALEDVKIKGYSNVAAISGATGCNFDNCYVTGEINANSKAGMLIGSCYTYQQPITNCYAIGDIEASAYVGGLVGNCYTSLKNCFSDCNVTGSSRVGGLIGSLFTPSGGRTFDDVISLSKVVGNDIETIGSFIGGIIVKYAANDYVAKISTIDCYVTEQDINKIGSAYEYDNGSLVLFPDYDVSTILSGITRLQSRNISTNIQVGIKNGSSSQIGFNTNFEYSLGKVVRFGIASDSAMSAIDDFVNLLSEKQTELGSVQNRLDSVLEEISTQYVNLVSSRSTLRDADIAEVSSTYIQQQILQQASATLMATANQSPAIALQLI